MGTILVVHDELNSLELPVFKKDDRSKPELRYFPTEEANQFLQNNGCADYLPLNAISVGYRSRQSNLRAREEFLQSLI